MASVRRGLFLCLLAAGCGQRAQVSNGGASEAQIERLSTPQEPVVVDTQAGARRQPLAPADLTGAGMAAPVCEFSRDGHMLLAVTPGDALARVAGILHHFAHSSPAGPTGGFFEDRMVSISVGRVGQVVPGEGLAGSWPGRLTSTNRRAHAQVELEGVWRCG